jgi:hypothetical protein
LGRRHLLPKFLNGGVMKNYYVDDFLKIGDSHVICEDYVITGKIKNVFYLIVSDGCSSSPQTEMGARILAHLAKSYIIDRFSRGFNSPPDSETMSKHIIFNAERIITNLRIPRQALDATLIIGLFFSEVNIFKLYSYGDMVYIKENENSSEIIISTTEFSKNAPFYLSYQLDETRKKDYHNLKIDKIIETKTYDKKSAELFWSDIQAPAYDNIDPITILNFKSILICSDGFSSFLHKWEGGAEPVNPFYLARPFLEFKNKKGEFLKRRMRRALSDLEQNDKASHYDDLSIAALTYEE